MDEWDYGDEKLPTDGGEDADCCKMFSCFWVRINRLETIDKASENVIT